MQYRALKHIKVGRETHPPGTLVQGHPGDGRRWDRMVKIGQVEVVPEPPSGTPQNAAAGGAVSPPAQGTKEVDQVEIPGDWQGLHHSTLIALARDLGHEDVATKDAAIAVIEAEVARRDEGGEPDREGGQDRLDGYQGGEPEPDPVNAERDQGGAAVAPEPDPDEPA